MKRISESAKAAQASVTKIRFCAGSLTQLEPRTATVLSLALATRVKNEMIV